MKPKTIEEHDRTRDRRILGRAFNFIAISLLLLLLLFMLRLMHQWYIMPNNMINTNTILLNVVWMLMAVGSAGCILYSLKMLIKITKPETIEEHDRTRYRYMQGLSLSFIAIVPLFFMLYLTNNRAIMLVMLALVVAGSAVVIFYSVKMLRQVVKIKKDPVLNEALNNEIYLIYKSRSLLWGFCFTIISAWLFTIIPFLKHVPMLFACRGVVVIGIVSLMIARLVYYRP